jgi:opacity protein-like surface antigen
MWSRPLLLFSILLLSPFPLPAESTIDVYGGYSDTKSADVTVTHYYFIGTPSTYSEPINGSSGTLGIRYVQWLEPETNLSINTEDKTGMNYSWVGFSADLFGFHASGENTDAYTVALSLDILFRYPHKTWQPYFGYGLLLHGSKVDASDQSGQGESASGSDFGLGFDFRTGLLWRVKSSFSLFAEYRYTSVNFKEDKDDLFFGGDVLSTHLRTNHYLLGVSFAH